MPPPHSVPDKVLPKPWMFFGLEPRSEPKNRLRVSMKEMEDHQFVLDTSKLWVKNTRVPKKTHLVKGRRKKDPGTCGPRLGFLFDP